MLGVLMVNALAACDRLLIPVQTEFLALKGLERMLRTLQMIGRSRGGGLPYTVIPTFFDRRTRASMDALRALRDQYGENLWSRVIPVDTQFRESSRAGVPINRYNPAARGSEAYQSLLRWLLAEAPATPETVEALTT
jgi:chromosome partitioning protein